MFLKILLVVIFADFCRFVFAVESTREMEGYPKGFLSDCPGSTKKAVISRRSLKLIQFIHVQKGHFVIANKTNYNYFGMKKLAKKLDFSKKTLVYQSGYGDNSNWLFLTPAMGAVYASKDYNVLLVHYWMFMAYPYPIAARLLRPVGLRVAEMLVELVKYGLDPKKVELAGVSHGGQGISFIAKSFRKLTGQTVSRMTGLDSAGPCFRNLGPEDRFDASDADRVDLIHTNGDAFGLMGAIAGVNFYVNGGEYQIFDIAYFLPCEEFCSHIRVFTIWASAMLHPDLFIALKCDTIQDARNNNCHKEPLVTNLMGPKTDFNNTGIFYVATTNMYPYGVGKKGLIKGYNYWEQLLIDGNKEKEIVV